jgi:monofunctional biosynthetic peptidoglycan transglycosylase
MEVYLNIAEMGKGVFGVEEAAMRNFGRHASKLTTHQAVCIACVLPNPLVRSLETAPQKNRSKYNITYRRTEQTPYPFKRK